MNKKENINYSNQFIYIIINKKTFYKINIAFILIFIILMKKYALCITSIT